MELGYAQGARSYQMQKKIRLICAMPDKVVELVPCMAARHTLILADLLSAVTNKRAMTLQLCEDKINEKLT